MLASHSSNSVKTLWQWRGIRLIYRLDCPSLKVPPSPLSCLIKLHDKRTLACHDGRLGRSGTEEPCLSRSHAVIFSPMPTSWWRGSNIGASQDADWHGLVAAGDSTTTPEVAWYALAESWGLPRMETEFGSVSELACGSAPLFTTRMCKPRNPCVAC